MKETFKSWFKEGVIPENKVDDALEMINEISSEIRSLSYERNYWEAYGELMMHFSLFNSTLAKYPTQQSKIIQRLLDWIKRIKDEIDKIVSGIGGNGYSIGVSFPWGISVSVSFPI